LASNALNTSSSGHKTSPSAAASLSWEHDLTTDELYRLTLYKWRYALEAGGFDSPEVPSLLFLKWLHTTGRLES
jgi:hypothetical protein